MGEHCTSIGRRDFLQLAGLSALSAAASAGPVVAGPFSREDAADHFVPADKKLSPAWIAALFAKGGRTFYEGADLATIAMPIGGICAGQLYLAGDGRLVHWDIFNQHLYTGVGRENYRLGRQAEQGLEQGFAIRIRSGGKTLVRTLDAQGYPGVRFCGEYPIGTVEYRSDDVPVAVTLEAFSPFCPLDEPDSALPATVMQFTLKNRSTEPAEVTLAGWLENGVLRHSSQTGHGVHRYRLVSKPGWTMLVGSGGDAESPRRSSSRTSARWL